MKLIKTFSLLFLFVAGAFSASAGNYIYGTYPAKTIVIKAAGASDPAKFFSTTKVVSFEIYQGGSADELTAIMNKLKTNKDVEQVIAGKVTGDYAAFNVSLKEVKDKAYWSALFKSAGLLHVKINNNDVVEVERM